MIGFPELRTKAASLEEPSLQGMSIFFKYGVHLVGS